MPTRAIPVVLAAALFVLAACEKSAPAPAPPGAPTPLAPAAPPVPAKVTTADEIVTPEVTLSQSPTDIAKGKELFGEKGCTTCHTSIGGMKALGPELKGVTARRSPTYIERMLLRPDIMIRTDPTAKQLFQQYSVPMTNQRIDPEKELPFLMDYLKSIER